MVLRILEVAAQALWPAKYTTHIIVGLVTLYVMRTFSQGRRTNRERDLHARKVLVTGGFTPMGLTLLQALAQRGAHIIALSSEPLDSPRVGVLVDLIRTTTSNEQVYAEQCDLASPSAIRAFCTKFLTGQDQRLDAIVFAHEYQHIGPLSYFARWRGKGAQRALKEEREAKSLATFLITTLLLPALLVAPAERDIRIITVVNRFYAAAAAARPYFSPAFTTYTLAPEKSGATLPSSLRKSDVPTNSIFPAEGTRSLRSIIFSRHLQRILDALPHAQAPKTDEGSTAVPVVSSKAQKSNIVSVSVSPGISRADTVAPLLNADWAVGDHAFSSFGIIIYLLAQPILRIYAKSPVSSIQTILHTLFLPTPFKLVYKPSDPAAPEEKDQKQKQKQSASDDIDITPVEVLKPGSLYSECAVVKLDLTKTTLPPEPQTATAELAKSEKTKSSSAKGKGKGSEKEPEGGSKEEILELVDDGELGGEEFGRRVWEAYEEGLKAWEKINPNPIPEESAATATATATATPTSTTAPPTA